MCVTTWRAHLRFHENMYGNGQFSFELANIVRSRVFLGKLWNGFLVMFADYLNNTESNPTPIQLSITYKGPRCHD